MSNAGSRIVGLVLTDDPTLPHDPRWAMHPRLPGPDHHAGLLGWIADRRPVDAGVPAAVADLVARAFVRVGMVTFLSPLPAGVRAADGWSRLDRDGGTGAVRALRPPPLQRLTGGWTAPLRATTDPSVAARLFDAQGFPWEQRGQVVFLSADRATPPPLTYRQVMEAFHGHPPLDGQALRRNAGITAAVFAGVDGDFVEMHAFDDATWNGLVGALEAEARGRGLGWRVVDGDRFARQSWFSAGGGNG